MSLSTALRLLCAFLGACLLAPATGRSVDTFWPASEGLLVLRNGFVLRGQITRLGDHYQVTMGEDDSVRLPTARVEMVCATLEEAYRRKRELVVQGDVRAHLALARWCLRHQLAARAADQILAAIALDPDNPLIESLQSRLRSLAGPQPSAPLAAGDSSDSPSSRHLKASLESLPSEAVREFTATIQPLLMNGCATSACHGGRASSKLRIVRPPVGQLVTSRMTRRNLHVVLKYVDRGAPFDSLLWTSVRRPHGGRDEPVLDDDDARTATLRDWLARLHEPGAARPASAEVREPTALLQRAGQTSDGEPASLPEEGETPVADATADQSATGDPFDPEIFHRRHNLRAPGQQGQPEVDD